MMMKRLVTNYILVLKKCIQEESSMDSGRKQRNLQNDALE